MGSALTSDLPDFSFIPQEYITNVTKRHITHYVTPVPNPFPVTKLTFLHHSLTLRLLTPKQLPNNLHFQATITSLSHFPPPHSPPLIIISPFALSTHFNTFLPSSPIHHPSSHLPALFPLLSSTPLHSLPTSPFLYTPPLPSYLFFFSTSLSPLLPLNISRFHFSISLPGGSVLDDTSPTTGPFLERGQQHHAHCPSAWRPTFSTTHR